MDRELAIEALEYDVVTNVHVDVHCARRVRLASVRALRGVRFARAWNAAGVLTGAQC
jgi:hypothetical protein